MSKANSNFDHLIRDKYGHKKVEGTYYAIHQLEERVEVLENLIKAVSYTHLTLPTILRV